jgi:hypothetical protein
LPVHLLLDKQIIREAQAVTKVKMNPLLQTAIFSLLNALGFFQKGDERHRQCAMIFMDQAAEYVLRAKLYQMDHIKFIDNQLERLNFEDVLKEVEKHTKLLNEEKFHLRRVHESRNYAQHRAVIPDSSWTREYIGWIYSFIHRFSQENFSLNIDSMIPSDFRAGILV